MEKRKLNMALDKMSKSIHDVREAMKENQLLTKREYEYLNNSQLVKLIGSKRMWKRLQLRRLA